MSKKELNNKTTTVKNIRQKIICISSFTSREILMFNGILQPQVLKW